MCERVPVLDQLTKITIEAWDRSNQQLLDSMLNSPIHKMLVARAKEDAEKEAARWAALSRWQRFRETQQKWWSRRQRRARESLARPVHRLAALICPDLYGRHGEEDWYE